MFSILIQIIYILEKKRHKLLLLLCLTHVKWPSADRCMNNVQNSYISNCQESVTNVCMVILNRTHPLPESRASIVGCPFNVHLIWSFWMHLNSSFFFFYMTSIFSKLFQSLTLIILREFDYNDACRYAYFWKCGRFILMKTFVTLCHGIRDLYNVICVSDGIG